MPIALLLLQLAAATTVILLVSQFLTKSADVIAEKTGLGRSLIGVVLLATATSLPELGTGISSIAVVGAPDLAAGDAFGSNLFNLLIIALLDFTWRNGPLLNAVSPIPKLVGGLSAGLIALASISVFLGGNSLSILGTRLSPLSIALLVMFAAAIFATYRYGMPREEESSADRPAARYADARMSSATMTYLVAAVVIVVAAVSLAKTGDSLAEEMGWEASFVGTLFLAFSTSLPELATSFAAIRLKAPELAITNLLGSNMFNMGFVLFLDDAAYTEGALWGAISRVHSLTGALAIAMTLVVIAALVVRPRRRPGKYWTYESAGLVAIYLTASVLVFNLA